LTKSTPPKIVAVEPYYGESHKIFLDQLAEHSRCQIELITLSPHRWQWRMRTAAIDLVDLIVEKSHDADILFVSDYLDLATLVGLAPNELGRLKKIVYFHENQLTYPVQEVKDRDIHFAVTNLTSCHAADEAWFNSEWHLRDFETSLKKLARKLRDGKSLHHQKALDKCRVVPLGVKLPEHFPVAKKSGPLKILWNHRWEYDKNPEECFEVLEELANDGFDFELSVCGHSFVRHPEIFDQLPKMLGNKLVHCGWLESKEEYYAQLKNSDVVISTAIHEFFGISIVEAIHFGCYPLLPNRLSYPEIIPPNLHDRHLWNSREDLKHKLEKLLPTQNTPIDSIISMDRFGWKTRILDFDQRFLDMATRGIAL